MRSSCGEEVPGRLRNPCGCASFNRHARVSHGVKEVDESPVPFSGNHRWGREQKEAGMVTSEIAIGLIPISFVTILIFFITSAMGIYLEVQDLSRTLAREASMGENSSELTLMAHEILPDSSVRIEQLGESVSVTVKAEPSGPLALLDLTLAATTVAALEPGVAR